MKKRAKILRGCQAQITRARSAFRRETMGKKHKREAPDPGDLAHGNGTVLRVKLTNFMCHHNLEVEFGPRINFLVGENGSGKSAVLTALSLALGVRARETRRTEKGIKGFIREGANFAKVEVSIRNVGDDALDPDVYGDVITVERHITQSSSSYKIKGKDGKDVGSSRDKLIRITDHFNIDVNNPVVVMSQDSSREFLHSGKAKDKYDFFTKATLLKDITNKLGYIKEQINEMNNLIKEKEKELPDVRAELDRLEEEKNSFTKLQELKNKVNELRERLAWGEVYQLETEQRNIEAEVAAREDVMPKIEELIAKNKRLAEEERAKATAANEEFHRELEKNNLTIAARDAARDRVRTLKRETKSKETTKISKANAIKLKQQDVEALETQIQDAQMTIAAASQAQDARLQQAVDKAQDRLDRALRAKADAEEAERRNDRDKQDAIGKEQHVEYRIRNVRDDIVRLENRLKTAQLKGDQVLAKFGHKMPELAKYLKGVPAGTFSVPPIGPVGAFLKLKDQKWARAVEEKIGGNLGTYLVSNMQDRAKLDEIMRHRIKMPAMISVVNLSAPAYAPGENQLPPSAYLKMTDVLEFTHPAVYNFLVDSTGLERSVLVANQEEGARVMFTERARNVNGAYTEHRVLERRGQAQIDYPMKSMNNARLVANEADLAKSINVELREKNNELKQLNADRKAASEAKHKIQKAVGDLTNKRHAAGAEVSRAKVDLSDARQQQQESIGPTQYNVDELERMLADAKDDVAPLEEEMCKAEEALETAQEAERLGEEELKRLDEMCADGNFMARQTELQRDFEAYTQGAATAQNSANTCEKRLIEVRDESAGLAQQLDHKAVQLTRAIEDAKKICDRDTAMRHLGEDHKERPVSELEREHERAMRRVEKEKAAYKRPETEVIRNWQDAKRKYDRLEQTIKTSRGPCNRLNAGRKKRVRMLKETSQAVEKMVSHRFNIHMAKKGHAGQVKVDFINAELHLDVKMNGAGQTVKDTRSMSGGERSYATLALTLALGENVESPFRAMDEFDVFMDAVNRKISMDALIEFARDPNNCDKQYLFITPQDISAVDAGASDIVVQRMKAARPQ